MRIATLTIVVALAGSSVAGAALAAGAPAGGPFAGAEVPGADGASSDEVPAGSGGGSESGSEGSAGADDADSEDESDADSEGGSGDSADVPPAARDAPRIADGDRVGGVLNGTNTEDWYRFDAEAGQAVRFVGAVAGDGGAGRITVVGPSGDELVNTSNRADLLDESPYGAVVEESGTHYVRFSVDASTVGDVRYPMELSIAPPDPAGENDARSDALSLGSGETVRDRRAEGEEDWFAVAADAGDRITATLAIPDSEDWLAFNDVGLEVYDEDGRRVGELDGARTTETNVLASDRSARQAVTAGEAGTYYVRVTDVSVEGYTGYDLSVDVSPGETDATPTSAPSPTASPSSPPRGTPTPAPTATPGSTPSPGPTPTATASSAPAATPTSTDAPTATTVDTPTATDSSGSRESAGAPSPTGSPTPSPAAADAGASTVPAGPVYLGWSIAVAILAGLVAVARP